MQKTVATLIILFFLSCNSHKRSKTLFISNGSCSCENISYSLVNCDTNYYASGSRTYWQWDCDSSWYTFESKKGVKRTLETFNKEDISKSESIGPQFLKEIGDKLWFKQQKVSGCCYPPSHFLLDSKSGKTLFYLPEELFVFEDIYKDLLCYFKDTSYKTIVIHNLMENNETPYPFNNKLISNTLKNGNIAFVKDLFNEPIFKANKVILSFQNLREEVDNDWGKVEITLRTK